MLRLFFNYLFTTLLVFVFLELIYVGVYFTQKIGEDDPKVFNTYSIELKDYVKVLDSGNALPRNKYIDILPYPSLKARSEELRDEYNRRAQIISIVEERKQVFLSKGCISQSLAAKVDRNIDKLKRQNNQVRLRYGKILSFAEQLHLARLSETNRSILEERATSLLKESEELLKQIGSPIMFK